MGYTAHARLATTGGPIKLIPFEITIPDDEVDDTLGLKLLDELPGILNWAIEGCLEWQEHGLQEPEKVTRATEAYREETEVLAQFVRECCTLNRELKTQSSFLHKAFEVYTGLSVSPVEFADIMGTSGFKKKTTDGRVYWIGIGVNAKS
jgi:putative DNA primase/helicase